MRDNTIAAGIVRGAKGAPSEVCVARVSRQGRSALLATIGDDIAAFDDQASDEHIDAIEREEREARS